MSNSCEFYINNYNNDSSFNYCASGVFYVSLDMMRNVFQFSSSDVSTNGLDTSIIDNSSADITYYCNSSFYPSINVAHCMMFGPHAINPIIDTSSNNNLLKHDYIRYLSKELFGTYKSAPLIVNRKNIIDNIEVIGWNNMNNNNTMMDYNYNNGYGLNNTDNSFNISKMIMKTIATYSPERFDISNGTSSNGTNSNGTSSNTIQNTTSSQPIPFIEGDTINYIFNIKSPQGQNITSSTDNNVNDRIYRVQLYLTNNTSYNNIQPSYSLSYDTDNSYNITHTGVP
jgi:hypothetical protein